MKTNAKIILFVVGAVLLSGAGVAGGVALNRLNKGIATPETSSKSSNNTSSEETTRSDKRIVPEDTTYYF